jgi:FkbM family methyltransferase
MRYDNVAIVPKAVSNTCGKLPLHMPQGTGKTHAATLEARNMGHRAWSMEYGARSNSNSTLHAEYAPGSSTLVDVTTLDDFFTTQDRGPNFLKIDVEGHELAVLEGATRTLQSHRPAILIECEARHRADGDVRPVFDLLQSHGYQGSFFLNGHRRPLAEFDVGKHQRIDDSATATPRDYVNNFSFVPTDWMQH